MKKKTILFALMGLCAVLFLANCGGDSAGSDGPTLSVSPTSITLDESNNNSATVNVTSNTEWTVSAGDSWVNCSPNSGTGGRQVTVTANTTSTTDRSTFLTFTDKTRTKTVTVQVTQKGTGVAPSPTDDNLFDEPCLIWGSTVTTVKSFMSSYTAYNNGAVQNVDGIWTLTYQGKKNEIETHYLFSTSTEGLYCSAMYFSASKYKKDDFANAFQKMGYTYSHTNEAGYQIYKVKDGKSYVTYYSFSEFWIVEFFSPSIAFNLAVNTESLSFDAASGSKTFQITTNDSWSVSSNATAWCTVSPMQSSNNATITVTVTANTGSTSRTATITVKGNNSNITKTITVTQAAAGGNVSIGRDDFGSDNDLNNK